MQMGKLAVLLLTMTYLNACGSVRVFELPKVQQNLQSTMQKSDVIAQKAQKDFDEKKRLIDNLSGSSTPTFKQNEAALRSRLEAMDEALQNIIVEKKSMSEANGDVASLSYSRQSVRSNEKEYPKVEEAVNRFEKAAARLNFSVLDYSRESNSMADLITQTKLYYNFDVADFQKRVQRNIKTAQDNHKVMERELRRSEAVINSNQTATRQAQEEILSEMSAAATDYSTRANRFAEINREVNTTVMGAARISSLDPNWPSVQALVSEFDRTVLELADINERFMTKVKAFRSPSIK
jgi:hypothetical protein